LPSTAEVDRRATERLDLDVSCRLQASGMSHTARVIDLSDGGAHVVGGPALAIGSRGTLGLDGAGFALPFRVRSSDGGSLRLEFDLDGATKALFRGMPERLARRPAA
jgi:hypothetical protein